MTKGAVFPFFITSGTGLGVGHKDIKQTVQTVGQASLNTAVNLANGNVCLRDRKINFANLNDDIEIAYYYNGIADISAQWRLCPAKELKKVSEYLLSVTNPDCHVIQ